jgi:SOS response regulatory protein OraA/RecX
MILHLFLLQKKLFSAANLVDENITEEITENWLSKQKTYTIHRLARKKFKRNPIIVRKIDEQWQLDLIDFSNLS